MTVKGVGGGLVEFDGLVVPLDLALNVGDGDVGKIAGDVPTVTSDADEVVVDTAVSGIPAEDHSRSTSPAGERALQVVLVALRALAGVTLSGQLGLNHCKGFDGGQGLVSALELNTAPGESPDVKGLTKDLLQISLREGMPIALRRYASA